MNAAPHNGILQLREDEVLRPIQEDDAELIEELEIQVFPEDCMNSGTLTREIRSGFGFFCSIAECPIAYALCRRDGDVADLLRLGVLPGHRGRGVGSRLLYEVMASAPQTMLTVRKSNIAALRLYRRSGFVIVADNYDDKFPSWVMLHRP